MYYDAILWDDPDDPGGNYRHIVETGLVSAEDVEDVIAGHWGLLIKSRSSGLSMVFGTSSVGLRLGVVFRVVQDGDEVLIRPVSAFFVED